MIEAARAAIARVRELFQRRRLAADLDDELRFHLEQEIQHNVARGMSATDARRAAMLSFGGVQRFREETHDARGFVAAERVIRDVRFTLRRLRRAPAFTAGVVGTLGIGLGAAAGIGALVYGVMLRPLPYVDPERLIRVSLITPGLGTTSTDHSPGTLKFFGDRARSFTELGGYYENDGVAITDGDEPERTTAAMVTPSVFRILGSVPALGRLFRDEDAVSDTVPVLVSYDIWQRRFGGDSAVIGKQIELNRGRRTIIGVLPKDFDFPSRAVGVWYPSGDRAKRADLTSRSVLGIGRLRRGVTVEQADAELAALVPRLPERFPELSPNVMQQSGIRATVTTLRAAIVAPVRGELTLLGLMVGIVLLIATVNVATLFLLRAERLRGEIAVGRALGASGGAIIQRFVIEGVVAAVGGGAVALPIAAAAVSTKLGFTTGEIPRLHDVHLGGKEIAVVSTITLIVGVVLGLVTAARAGAGGASDALRDDRRSVTAGRTWRRTQEGFVAVQIALALALLLGATLMGQSLLKLRRVDIGFTPRNRATFDAALPFSAYPTYQRTVAFHFEVMRSLAAQPGMGNVAAAMRLPLIAGQSSLQHRIQAAGDPTRNQEATAQANVVSANYFAVMGIGLRTGRSFAPGDLAGTPSVILSTSLARELFAAADPLGRSIRLVSDPAYPAYRVVGVVGDVFGERIPDGVIRVLYFPLLADLAPASLIKAPIPYNPSVHYIVQSTLPIGTLAPAFRQAVALIDHRVPVAGVKTLDAIVSSATARTRLMMFVLAVAAVATALLGAIGLYSVVAYAVAGRATEFGVRLALGATEPEIVGLVLRQGAIVLVAGLTMGTVTSLAGSRFVQRVLYNVDANDPMAYVCAVGVMFAAAAAAAFFPARSAGRTDPARTLRGS